MSMRALPGTHKSHNVGWPEDSNLGSLGWAWETCILAHVCVCACVCPHVRSVVSDSLQPHGLQSARLLCPWDSPGKNPGVGCHCLLQGIFPTQGSNPHLLYL